MGRQQKKRDSSLQSDSPQASENISEQSLPEEEEPRQLAGRKRGRPPTSGKNSQRHAAVKGSQKGEKLLAKSDDELDDDDLIEKLEA